MRQLPVGLHLPIRPGPGTEDMFRFAEWEVRIENGRARPIPSIENLPRQHQGLPDPIVTRRIFRWAVSCDFGQIG